MKKWKSLFLFPIALAALFACQPRGAARSSDDPRRGSQLVRAESLDRETAYTRVLGALEAEGYQVTQSNEKLGYINACKASNHFTSEEDVATSQLEVTIHIRDLESGGSEIKTHFIGKDYDSSGIVTALKPVQDVEVVGGLISRLRSGLKPSSTES